MPDALRYDERPYDETPVHTEDLPATPVRDRNIPPRPGSRRPPSCGRWATTCRAPMADYKRRIGPVAAVAGRPGDRRRRPLLGGPEPTTWRSTYTFRLFPSGDGAGAARAARPPASAPGRKTRDHE